MGLFLFDEIERNLFLFIFFLVFVFLLSGRFLVVLILLAILRFCREFLICFSFRLISVDIIFLFIFLKGCKISFILQLADTLCIFMNIKVRRIKLENRYSNVRTVRCDTLVVCKQVIKSKSGIQITLTISKSLNVTKFQIITENTNQFAQRFNLCSSLKILIYKRI